MRTSLKNFIGNLHEYKMVELYTIVTLFEYMILTLDLTVTYRNKRVNKTAR